VKLPSSVAGNLDSGTRHEWLEADGLGGFAMGTVAGPATRRYHALLCTATRPPTGRMVLINRLEEWIEGEALTTHAYVGAMYPDGVTRLAEFRLDPWPVWVYEVAGRVVERCVLMVEGRALCLVGWRLVAGTATTVWCKPLGSGRDYHALQRRNDTLNLSADVSPGRVRLSPYPGVPTVTLQFDPAAVFRPGPNWFCDFDYARERERGLEATEDLWTPGELGIPLVPGKTSWLVLSTEQGMVDAIDPDALAVAERARRAALAATEPDDFRAQLRLAADKFVVRRGSGRSIVAGYPWFTDWGRDAFISLGGLGPHDAALERDVLLSFAPHVQAGLVPNRFVDVGDAAEYNSVDAPLWFVLACCRYLRRSGDWATFETQLLPAVRQIFDAFLDDGTRYHIGVDDDGLLHAAEPGLQLTWMDAKVGDWVVTPRMGKPVEIQALWVAALEAVAVAVGAKDAAWAHELGERAAWARSSFTGAFWDEGRGWLNDVVDGPRRDGTLRPNQLYALGLGAPMIGPSEATRVLIVCERELVTPVGLRSRARGDGYRGRYDGDIGSRDGAYHEGTVWPYLLGIWADACMRVRGAVPTGILDGIRDHLQHRGVGQVAEIFDGDEPHWPRGCPAQAWSVAESLRIARGDVGV